MSLAIRGILFDKDGTLLDFDATWLPAYRRGAEAVAGLAGEVRAESLLAAGGFDAATGRCAPRSVLAAGTNREIATVWARLCALDVDIVAREIEREFFDTAGRDAVPVTDLDAFFAALAARGFVLGVATMDGEAAARAALDRLGAGRHLAFLCGGDSGWGTKPGPGMVHAFLATTGLRAFNRREFQDLLFRCHSILRDVHKMDPGRAFDTISKILFVKMYVERSGLHGTFTADFLDRRASTRLPSDPLVHDDLFERTKDYYRTDDLFTGADRLEISEETFRRIVKELERFDLSKTGDDVKGLAFEKFLGSTFRGELGQFFTPRPVVDFMVNLLDPREDELICDPAAGSGGFLIRAFEHVRGRIAAEVQAEKDRARAEIEAQGLAPEEEESRVDAAFAALNRELLASNDHNRPADTRVGRLAWRCIFGCDAEPRAARTAKMNMIMHGDGHGGIHYHDGLVDINGIFPSRFDVVVTNPPFGSNVGSDQKIGGSDETRIHEDEAYVYQCRARYGDAWERSYRRMRDAAGTNILDLFEIGRGKANRATEIVFVERCLSLLKPGGRMGIVLPDGNLNNPSLTWLRRWCEGKARIAAVVSLPEETFRSADATVKASLVFLRRFTDGDERAWEGAWAAAHAGHDGAFNARRDALCADFGRRIATGESQAAGKIVDELAKLGVERTAPAWSAGPPPGYPRGIGPTRLAKPRWKGSASDKERAARLKRDYAAVFGDDEEARAHADARFRELRTALRALDEAHHAALWATVREAFDYPVFVAAPAAVGITSTGETGENVPDDLPRILDAFRAFETWVETGAKPEDAPDFRLPSAA